MRAARTAAKGTDLAFSEGNLGTSQLPGSPSARLLCVQPTILAFSGTWPVSVFLGAYNRRPRRRAKGASLRKVLMLCLLEAAWHARVVRKGPLTQPPKAAWD